MKEQTEIEKLLEQQCLKEYTDEELEQVRLNQQKYKQQIEDEIERNTQEKRKEMRKRLNKLKKDNNTKTHIYWIGTVEIEGEQRKVGITEWGGMRRLIMDNDLNKTRGDFEMTETVKDIVNSIEDKLSKLKFERFGWTK